MHSNMHSQIITWIKHHQIFRGLVPNYVKVNTKPKIFHANLCGDIIILAETSLTNGCLMMINVGAEDVILAFCRRHLETCCGLTSSLCTIFLFKFLNKKQKPFFVENSLHYSYIVFPTVEFLTTGFF